jgi:hypothetical protein
MEKHGLIKDGQVIKVFDDEEVGFKEWMGMADRMNYGFRRLKFSELTEDEKLESMEERLNSLNAFLKDIKGSGRTYNSHTPIYSVELEWLIEHTKKNMRNVRELRA